MRAMSSGCPAPMVSPRSSSSTPISTSRAHVSRTASGAIEPSYGHAITQLT